MRRAVGAVGVLVGLYGGYLLLQLGWSNLVAAVIWMAGAVVVHDGVLGPALVVVGIAVLAVVRGPARAPVTAGLVVLGTVTVTAVPVLTRMGARADNPTLLDRHYVLGWCVFATLVATATMLGVIRTQLRDPHGETEPHR
jgi:hypothetical protein